MGKLRARIHWPAALIMSTGMVCIALAYLACPAEYRAETLAGIATAWGFLQAYTRGIVRAR